MNSRIVKLKGSDDLYEIEYIIHRANIAPSSASDVFAARRMSKYDGMPIGPRVWIAADQFEDADLDRVRTLNLPRQRED